MSLYRSRLRPLRPEKPCWHVIVPQAERIKPVFKRGARAVVRKHFPTPEAFQRRYLVIARPSPGLESKARVSAYRHWQDFIGFPVALRDSESLHGRKHIVGVLG